MTKAPDDTLIVKADETLPTRRDMLCRIGGGFGALALSSMLTTAKSALIAMGLTLFVMTLVVNFAATAVVNRSTKRMQGAS